MGYKVVFTGRVLKQLDRIPKEFRTVLVEKILTLKDFNPRFPNVKALKGEFSGYYRLRVGRFRAVFEVRNGTATIVVLTVDDRKGVYR